MSSSIFRKLGKTSKHEMNSESGQQMNENRISFIKFSTRVYLSWDLCKSVNGEYSPAGRFVIWTVRLIQLMFPITYLYINLRWSVYCIRSKQIYFVFVIRMSERIVLAQMGYFSMANSLLNEVYGFCLKSIRTCK